MVNNLSKIIHAVNLPDRPLCSGSSGRVLRGGAGFYAAVLGRAIPRAAAFGAAPRTAAKNYFEKILKFSNNLPRAAVV